MCRRYMAHIIPDGDFRNLLGTLSSGPRSTDRKLVFSHNCTAALDPSALTQYLPGTFVATNGIVIQRSRVTADRDPLLVLGLARFLLSEPVLESFGRSSIFLRARYCYRYLLRRTFLRVKSPSKSMLRSLHAVRSVVSAHLFKARKRKYIEPVR